MYLFRILTFYILIILTDNIVFAAKIERTALVIGNANYTQGRLKNPINDAKAMAKLLKQAGFDVMYHTNLNLKKMNHVISEFGQSIAEKGGGRLFYYAGHGIQYNGENYLIPINAKPNRSEELPYEAVNLGRVLDNMDEANDGFNIVILDACRDNPLPRSYNKGRGISSKRGLVSINESPIGTLIAFATSPGETASDGFGRHGTYTNSLIKYLSRTNLDVIQVFTAVGNDVTRITRRAQVPWFSSSLIGKLYFFGDGISENNNENIMNTEMGNKMEARNIHNMGF